MSKGASVGQLLKNNKEIDRGSHKFSVRKTIFNAGGQMWEGA